MYEYLTVKETLNTPEFGEYTTFGIKIAERKENAEPEAILFISDVSLNQALVESITERCTEHQLSPIHIFDVIEDEI